MQKSDSGRPKAAAPSKTKKKAAIAAPVETDRRGKVLPARQRVGGIITPQ